MESLNKKEHTDSESKLPIPKEAYSKIKEKDLEIEDNVSVKLDKESPKKGEQNEEPKPRIVLTFRSERPGLKTNMKIVSTEEKSEEVSPRRSTRFRGNDSDTHDEESHDNSKSRSSTQTHSESEDGISDGQPALKRSTRRRSKEFSDNILANAIARKEKSYNETSPTQPTQRLSRRIKPTAKILANKELRLGLETQNNARMGLASTSDKSPDDGVQTRRSTRRKSAELSDENSKVSFESPPKVKRTLMKRSQNAEDEMLLGNMEPQDKETRRLNKLKKKHLSKLGLKAVDAEGRAIDTPTENCNDESTMDSTNTEAIIEHLNNQKKHLETDKGLNPKHTAERVSYDEQALEEDSELIDELLATSSEPDDDDEDYDCSIRETTASKRANRKSCTDRRASQTQDNTMEQSQTEGLEKTEEGRYSGYSDSEDDDYRGPPRRSTRLRRCHTEDIAEMDYPENDDERHDPPRRSPRKVKSWFEDGSEPAGSIVDEKEAKESKDREQSQTEGLEKAEEGAYSGYSDSDEDYRGPPRRSTRLRRCHAEDIEMDYPEHDDERHDRPRRSPRKVKNWFEDGSEPAGSVADEKEAKESKDSEPASGDEGSEATCPDDDNRIIATCYCADPSNIYANPADLKEPIFCRAVEVIEGIRIGCSHSVDRDVTGSLAPLRRASPRSAFMLTCKFHASMLDGHMCCPTCGIFCTQGLFYRCSEGHLFHIDCGIPYGEVKNPPGCPHCGMYSYKWHPVNRKCQRVKLEMQCTNKRIFLPEQRVQCTPAYIGFSKLDSKTEVQPIIPEEFLLTPPVDLKSLCLKNDDADYDELLSTSASQRLISAIVGHANADDLMPKLMAGVDVNSRVEDNGECTYLHIAARCGNLSAVYLLHYAGANVDATDAMMRTPLMLAILALVDKSPKQKEKKLGNFKDTPEKKRKLAPEPAELAKINENEERLLKVVKYLVAAGCDVNFPGPEGMSALHVCAQHGLHGACAALLESQSAHIDPRDHGGWTPLVWAAENSHHQTVRLLLSRGADASARDGEGNAILHWCALGGDATSLALLLDAADHQHKRTNELSHALDALNAHGDTPLHVAARHGHYPCVVILLARGARTDIENGSGELAVEVCSGDCQSVISINMQVSLAVQSQPLAHYRLLSSDISNGRELYPIPCINEVDNEEAPADFTYVTRHVFAQPLLIDNTISTLQGCECIGDDCSSGACACGVLGVKRWYRDGRLIPTFPFHEPPMIFECNRTCGCNMKRCGNCAVGRAGGATLCRAQVYRYGGGRGWGLRAGTGIRKGAPVALYTGELLPVATADTRPNDHYMFALDLKQDLLQECVEKTQLCVDAAQYGSAARFINHSCRPNLAPVRVFTEVRDLRLPTITLFATKDIRAYEELTFDYGDKFWSVKSKWMSCECGSSNCRYQTRSSEEATDSS